MAAEPPRALLFGKYCNFVLDVAAPDGAADGGTRVAAAALERREERHRVRRGARPRLVAASDALGLLLTACSEGEARRG